MQQNTNRCKRKIRYCLWSLLKCSASLFFRMIEQVIPNQHVGTLSHNITQPNARWCCQPTIAHHNTCAPEIPKMHIHPAPKKSPLKALQLLASTPVQRNNAHDIPWLSLRLPSGPWNLWVETSYWTMTCHNHCWNLEPPLWNQILNLPRKPCWNCIKFYKVPPAVAVSPLPYNQRKFQPSSYIVYPTQWLSPSGVFERTSKSQ